MIKPLSLAAAVAAALLMQACATPGQPTVTHLNSGKVLPTGLPFSEAVRVGDTVYMSGQIGNMPGPGPIKLAPGGMPGEATQVMDNIKTALEAHGLSMGDVVKCTVMLADMKEWGAFNDVYKTYFSGHFPARSAFGSNGLAFNARVEVECIAVARK